MTWPKVKLGEVCDLNDAGVWGDEPTGSGDIFVLRSNNIQDFQMVFADAAPRQISTNQLAKKELETGDIIITASSGSAQLIGKCARFEHPGDERRYTFSNFTLRVRPARELDSKYLYFYLTSPEARSYLTKINDTTTGLRNLNKGLYFDQEIPLPPLAEQKRLAAILDRADDLRRLHRQVLARLDELAQSLFLELFGDPATNPKGWDVGTIKQIATSINYGTSQKSEPDGETPYLRMNNITYSGEWDFGALKYITLSDKDREKYLAKSGDILFNRTNSAELVGKTAVFRSSDPMAFAGYLIRLRLNAENHPEYVAAFMNMPHTKKVLRTMCKSIIGMANINAQELGAIQIPLPPLALQNQFAAQIEEMEAVKARARASATEADALFASLQSRAFSGELAGGEE